ncbi:MAG: MFS transporter [Bacteroidetes bacterium]|nr:MAG: MFS transporter [Bacteroidota bacterium]TAE71463.1 MAG: MFS transporter [Bacteroidota bacterium]
MSTTTVSHPKGLRVLFTTEMWERFNFYGMRALLTLFIVNALQFSDKDASIIYGGFLGLSYLTPMLGGYISDRYLGNRNCILLGGSLMAIGQLLLFFSGSIYETNLGGATTIMWAALGVIILGNGFFKPNISSMVGSLYPKGDSRLDSAFTIFYMGINVGAFLGMTVCPLLGDVKNTILVAGVEKSVRDVTAFKWGFLAAGAAMAIGTVVFLILKNKYIVTPTGDAIGGKPVFNAAAQSNSEESEKAQFTNGAILGVVGLLVALFFGIHYLSIDAAVAVQNPIKVWVYPFIYAAGISLAVLILTDKTITKVERDRILVMYTVAFFVIFFWSAFEQAGSSLTFVADKQTDLRLFGWEMPPSFVQNANSIFVIAFALPFSALWLWLQNRKAEPGSTVKQSIGLALLSVGYFIIALQVKDIGTSGKLGVIWLIVMYMFHTMGELCLSPIGLSLVSKLAPKRFSSLLMGVWFIGNAAGYALAGTLGALIPPTGDKFEAAKEMGVDLQAVLDKTATPTAEQLAKLAAAKIDTVYPTFAGFTIHNLYEFFMVFVVLSGVASALLFVISGRLSKMMHGVK